MVDDDELCLCFHVTRRKVRQYIRTEKPSRASQLSQCYGAGTGCGWCRPFLKRLLDEERETGDRQESEDLTPQDYARQRRLWRQSNGG